MKDRFIRHADSIAELALRQTCMSILDTPEFLTHPASLSFHHVYEGGLLAHTVEVADMACAMVGSMDTDGLLKDGVDFDILVTAALWHDFMTVREYDLTEIGRAFVGKDAHLNEAVHVNEMWYHTDYGRRIHHIPGSAIEFTVAARKYGVTEDVIEQVQHCILAHHGRKEWGSSVEPQTLEALILHQADMLSAKFGATKNETP